MEKEYKSYIMYYWFGWAVAVSILFLVKFTILPNASEDELFNVFGMFNTIITWILLTIFWVVEDARLNRYMNKYHKDYWNSNRVTGNGYSSYNTLYKYKQLKNDNFNDTTIEKIKLNHERLTIFTWIIFSCYPIIFIIGMQNWYNMNF